MLKMTALGKSDTSNFAPGFIETLERRAGQSIDRLQKAGIDERRKELELKFMKPMEFKSYFPLVGRGTVLHDRTVSRQKIDDMLDEALDEKPKSFLAKLFTRCHR